MNPLGTAKTPTRYASRPAVSVYVFSLPVSRICFRYREFLSLGGLEVFMIFSKTPNLPTAKAINLNVAVGF